MSEWQKSDGAQIQITFDRPIVSGQTGNEDYFTITVKEYDYVPGGTLRSVVKSVKETYAKGTVGKVGLADGVKTNVSYSGNELTLEVIADG